MASGFDDPEGDPGGLAGHVTTLADHATTVQSEATDLRTGFDHALTTWKAPRAAAFRSAGEGLDVQTARTHADLTGAVDALGTFREQLRHAKDRIADLREQADRARRRGADATKDLPADDPDAVRRDHATDAEVERLREEADGVHRTLASRAATARTAIDGLVDAAVPQGSRLTPAQLQRRVTAAGVGDAGSGLAAGTLTAAQAWAALAGAQDAAPPEGWRAWAKANGLTVPDHLDTSRALALQARLDAVLRNGPTDPALRSRLVHDFAATLSPEDLTSLAAMDPARVGNLDGMPNTVRYFANTINVSRGLESEQQRLDDWQPPPTTDQDSYADWVRLKGRIDTLRRLAAGETVGHTTGPHQILAFEPPTYGDDDHPLDDGRLAVVVGNLDTADHVGVVVPGITNRIDNFGGTLDRAANTQQQVPGSATVAWLGYDTPEFADSVTTEKADAGGAALHSFLAGVQRARDSDMTIIAHSYGTLVTSKALQLGSADHPLADRVVLFGSPGLGENVRSLSDLHLPDDFPIFAMRAPGDPVAITAAHGIDPVDIPGITRLDTDWNGPEDVEGHSQYTDQRTDSLFNVGRVLAGDLAHVVEGGNALADDGLAGPFNQNVRNLVDLLQEQVPADVQSRFVSGLQADLLRRIEAHDFPTFADPADVPELVALIEGSAAESGLGDYLTQDELEEAVVDAGFTDTAGDLVGDEVEDFVDDLDQADGLSIPLGPYGLRVPVPDGLNETAGTVFGAGSSFLTEHLGDLVVRNLPRVEDVLGLADAYAYTVVGAEQAWQGVQDAYTGGREVIGDARDWGADRLDDVGDFGEDVADTVGDTASALNPFD